MDTKQMKRTIKKCLEENGFIKDSGYFRKSNNEVTYVIGVQNHPHAKGCYINLGIIIQRMEPFANSPRDVDGHIRARFYYNHRSKRTDHFNPDNFSDTYELYEIVQKNLDELLPNTLDIDGIKDLLARRPVMLYQTTLAAKRFLGFE